MLKLDAEIAAWLVAADAAIESILREALASTWTLFLSFLLIMQWHVMPVFPDDDDLSHGERDLCTGRGSFFASFRACFMDRPDTGNAKAYIIGLNLLTLHLFFTPRLQGFTAGAPFVFFFLVILYNTYALYRLRNKLAFWAGLLKDKRLPKVEGEYMDFSGKVSKAVFLGIAQFTLMVYYIVALYEKLKRPNFDEVSCLTWAMGVVLIVAASSKTGRLFDMGRWDYIEVSYRWIVQDWANDGDGKSWRTGRFSLAPDGEKLLAHVQPSSTSASGKVYFRKELQEVWFKMGVPPVQNIPSYYLWKFVARKHMDFSINAFSRLVILSTAPILFSLSAALESLKKSVAIFFIVKLDDLGTPIPVDTMIDRFVEKYGPESAEQSQIF